MESVKENPKVVAAFNKPNPDIAYICNGLRRIAVNPLDRRVQKVLLSRGIRYRSRVQHFFYRMLGSFKVDVFLDIGSNYGECALSVPLYTETRIIGYEANVTLIPYLQKSLTYNDDIQNIEWRNVAMGDTVGQSISFFVNEVWSGKSSVLQIREKQATEVTVVTTTIDHEMKDLSADCHFLLIKLDIEGYEPAAIAGARNTFKKIPNIAILLEFDSTYLETGGVTPEGFFNELAESFDIQELNDNADVIGSSTYASLTRTHAGTKVHTDLILTKFEDPVIKDAFMKLFVGKNLYG